MATAPVHTPARFHTAQSVVHIASRFSSPPYSKAYCGHVRNRPLDPSKRPDYIVCLALYERRWGRPHSKAA